MCRGCQADGGQADGKVPGVKVPRDVGDDNGRYVVGDLLGEGAMGVVYAAQGPGGERVAIKFLHDHLASLPDVVERFHREARIVSRLRSPFIAPVRMAGRTQGRLWIAYRRLFGETLEDRLVRERALPAEGVSRIVGEVLEGLAVAHKEGVVHRDIKPSNVFLERVGRSERACLLDFGISKYTPPAGATTDGERLTNTSQILGTASYMAPEQIEGASEVDGRADLFSVGVVAFRALTGTLPFEGTSASAILHAKLYGQFRTLDSATGQRWGPPWEQWIRRTLAVRPEDRFQASDAMLADWRALLARGGAPDVAEVLANLGPSAPTSEGTIESAPSSH
jgi:serine/threonine-protein kinase